MDILARVDRRLSGENIDINLVQELIDTVTDRICLLLDEDSLPNAFDSICVDAVVKMYRRTYYEGISSEGTADINTSFVDNVLSEYEAEIQGWVSRKLNKLGSGRVVRFR